LRRRRDEVPIDGDEWARHSFSTPPEQTSWMDSRDFLAVITRIPAYQREALLLVGGEGVSYEEAAEICGCAVGTIKSRVHRARAALSHLLDGDAQEDRAALADRPQALDAA
jgi:RNA polymerase sigma-70 factor (ECF subfamily)